MHRLIDINLRIN